jgi:hypothetical protein
MEFNVRPSTTVIVIVIVIAAIINDLYYAGYWWLKRVDAFQTFFVGFGMCRCVSCVQLTGPVINHAVCVLSHKAVVDT